MCRIAVCHKNRLNKKIFDQSWDCNPDGMGLAYIKNNQVRAIKGIMDKRTAWNLYKSITFPHVVHFRVGTGGGAVPELTHPFICSPDSPAFKFYEGEVPVLFHNGVIGGWQGLAISHWSNIKSMPKGSWNDTRFITTMMSRLPTSQFASFLKHAPGESRYVIVSKDGFKMIGQFWKQGGISYSDITPKELDVELKREDKNHERKYLPIEIDGKKYVISAKGLED